MHALVFGKARDGRAHAACAGGRRLDVAGDRPDGEAGRGMRSNRGGCRAFLDQPAAWPGGERLGGPALSRHRRAKIDRRRRGGRAKGARRERADPAFERWRGAHARRCRFARDPPARSALGGGAEAVARGRHRGASAFVQGLCASGGLAREGGGFRRIETSALCPRDSAKGGQFQSGGGGSGGSLAAPGIGHDAGAPLDEPPEIPPVDPLTEQLRNAFAKLAARWLARALAGAAFGPEGEFVVALEAAAETALWLYEKYPLIKAYLDGPKSLEELQNNVGKTEKGYDVHHIVEQTASETRGYRMLRSMGQTISSASPD